MDYVSVTLEDREFIECELTYENARKLNVVELAGKMVLCAICKNEELSPDRRHERVAKYIFHKRLYLGGMLKI